MVWGQRQSVEWRGGAADPTVRQRKTNITWSRYVGKAYELCCGSASRWDTFLDVPKALPGPTRSPRPHALLHRRRARSNALHNQNTGADSSRYPLSELGGHRTPQATEAPRSRVQPAPGQRPAPAAQRQGSQSWPFYRGRMKRAAWHRNGGEEGLHADERRRSGIQQAKMVWCCVLEVRVNAAKNPCSLATADCLPRV